MAKQLEPSQLGLLLRELDLPEKAVIWLEPGLRLLLILLIWWGLQRLVQVVIRRFETRLMDSADFKSESQFEARKRVETLVRLVRQTVSIVLFVLLALVLLMQLGVQIGPLIAGAGIIGVAVGFGAQYLVRDLITGFFMVLENQIRVGDVVTINGTGGLVETLSLRTIVLRDVAGVVHVFPHGTVTTLSNATRDWSAHVFNIAIALKEDPQQATAVIRAVVDDLRKDAAFAAKIIADVEIFGVDKLDGGSFTLQGRIKTRPGMQSDVGREFLRRLKQAFEVEQIELPSGVHMLQLLPAATLPPIKP